MSSVVGDSYDFIIVDEKHLGILIADVSGHGLPAALIASMLKVVLTAQSPHVFDPARVLAGLNRSSCGKFKHHFCDGGLPIRGHGEDLHKLRRCRPHANATLAYIDRERFRSVT